MNLPQFFKKGEAPKLPFYLAEIDPDINSELEVNFIGLVEQPAIEKNFQAFRAQVHKARFTVNEDKQIISGPAMIANMPIYRKDEKLGEYYVVFDKATIRSIVEKFSAKGYLQNFNLFHDVQQKVSDVTIFNSFISDKELGIAPLKGFEDTADGSWFITAKVNNPAVWQKIKAGMIKGFSVEGMFSFSPGAPAKMSDETADKMIRSVFKRYDSMNYKKAMTEILAILSDVKTPGEDDTFLQCGKWTDLSLYKAFNSLKKQYQL